MGAASVDRLAVRAPGRVNLIGEHTDYNQGYVLPVAINLEIRLEVAPTTDRVVDIRTEPTDERGQFQLDAIGSRRGQWIDYVAGVALVLQQAGVPTGGFVGRLTSNLPMSAGLSSSAALELVSAWALMVAADPGAVDLIDRMQLALLCQRAENGYVGVNSGLMDQFASSCGVAGNALLLDCRSLDYRKVPIPSTMRVVVVDTGTARRLVSSEYNARRAECERGVTLLKARGEHVASLRDATVGMLDAARGELGDVTYRRCRHVVEENERTLAAAAALETGDAAALGELFAASHASLRDLYEVSSDELDAAVEIARSTPGVIATRMTGAGFGGCTVNLVEASAVDRLRSALENQYKLRTGLEARIYEVAAVDGAGLVERAA
jgi:galactokinase